MNRLFNYGIRGTVLLWLKNFFASRTHQTKVDGSLSDVVNLLSGVVQGSGIGPLMFLLCINELINILDNHDITVFADDVKLYLEITNDVDISQLQCALDSLQLWADQWQLAISVNKCCVLSIGNSRIPVSLNIDNIVLTQVTQNPKTVNVSQG